MLSWVKSLGLACVITVLAGVIMTYIPEASNPLMSLIPLILFQLGYPEGAMVFIFILLTFSIITSKTVQKIMQKTRTKRGRGKNKRRSRH